MHFVTLCTIRLDAKLYFVFLLYEMNVILKKTNSVNQLTD